MKKFSIFSNGAQIPAEMLCELGIENDKNSQKLSLLKDESVCGFEIEAQKDCVVVKYSQTAYLYRALSFVSHEDTAQYHITQKERFKTSGVMVDCSRNAVINTETLKYFIRCISRMGMNRLMLYTEDTYEIPGDRYFGHMRGRYSQNELRELDFYAKLYGVELVPCIQTLGHLAMALKWAVYENIKETDHIILIDEPETYELIERMIRSCRDCFTTDVIHIGMDEAEMIGRGNYYNKHGDSNKFELMCRHLQRVVDICKKYGFSPMIWSDMFFKLANDGDYRGHNPIPRDVAEKIPKGTSLVYWEYLKEDPAQYDCLMKNHMALPSQTVFAGGLWKWNSFLPALSPSMKRSKIAYGKCAEHGIEHVFTTVWGDDGNEASLFSVMPCIALCAELGFNAEVDDELLAKRLYECTGAKLSDFEILDMPDLTPEQNNGLNNPHKYLLYNDVLLGLFDKHCPNGIGEKYAEFYKTAAECAKNSKVYKEMFETAAALYHTLELKAEFGIKLKKAYDGGDLEYLKLAADEIIPEIIKRARHLRDCLENQWMKENKPFGFEVQDIRFGALTQRLESARSRLVKYCNGEISEISELAEERLVYKDGEGIIKCEPWQSAFTASCL